MSEYSYGYARIEKTGDGSSLVFSGVLLNNSGPTTNLTLTFTFSGVSGSFSTGSFSLPTGDCAAFAHLIAVSFSGSHTGSLEIFSGNALVESCSFSSDTGSEDLGFQNVIVAHAMPDVTYPNLPSGMYSMGEISS